MGKQTKPPKSLAAVSYQAIATARACAYTIPTINATSHHRLAIEGWAPTFCWLAATEGPAKPRRRGSRSRLAQAFSLTCTIPPLAVICHQTQMQYSTFAYSSPSYFTGHGNCLSALPAPMDVRADSAATGCSPRTSSCT
ncbi:uncharacterized protein TRIVIDRAFT_224895 [Trichoderma virens Gv29-8]|uniref:Uncharacterized protein n=1 Tax=Hypocrea virens (strain Gv29-8 / FGSC 10586) TaxID=413071 RepID=G9N1Q4_HYPVG|nr:uncharacterized protein TRIVIDRAFT_224895 [Trichoderma virens Gv29-8]EHK19683.1 hypothetical protein TRIVIDRAFT_224895 [Trichoderma virens Gv29-8]